MKILIAYATTEGTTQKICVHLLNRLADSGHAVALVSSADADQMDVARFDGVIVGASVHAGHYQRAVTDFATNHAAALNTRPTLFLSVSLAAAGHDAEDWRALDDIAGDFAEATGWTPDQTEHVAGAYTPSRYDMFRRLIMRRILAAKDPTANLDNDIEYTDWNALGGIVDAWVSGIA